MTQLDGRAMAGMRRDLGLTQRQLAALISSSERTVRRVEHEQAPVRTRGRHNVALWHLIEARFPGASS